MTTSENEPRQGDTTQGRDFDPEQGWEQLADVVEEFCEAWESAPPEPDLEPFAKRVRAIPGDEFARLGLIELVKVDLEYRAQSEFAWKPLEIYLEQWPELGPIDNPPTELIYEEYQHCLKQDSTLPVGHYEKRFPANYEALLKMVNDDTVKTLSLFRSKSLNDFVPGQSVNDFDLLSRLGRGAFAVVFLARQNSMQRLVALKISANQGLEGQTLAQLDHPHIVRVYDQQVLDSQNLRLMYMQYISGGSLADIIQQCHSGDHERSPAGFLAALDEMLANAGQSPPVESPNRNRIRQANWSQVISQIGSQIASALEYAHEHEVLHRDLKPANILVDEHGYPKLVDFNVSFGKQVIGASAASFFGGSVAYMSLEQLEAMSPDCPRRAEELSGACDVYSLGIMLYELLVGRRPFSESSEFRIEDLIGQFVDSRTQGLPADARKQLEPHGYILSNAIQRALEPDPERRIKPASLKKQLEWAADSTLDSFLTPHRKGWRVWASWKPFATVICLSFVIATFAAWFIISYNLAEAIEEKDVWLYTWIRRGTNVLMFNGGMIALYVMFRPALRILKQPQGKFSSVETRSAIYVNLNYGHWAAVLFILLWTVAGLVYPIGLTIGGAGLAPTAWLDFIGSHLLAGLTTGAYVFCGVTCCSLAAWQPQLIRTAMQKDVLADWSHTLHRLRQRIAFYQVLAIATPLASIAALVTWRQTTNSFALGILSTGALAGLVFLSWTLRQIQRSLEISVELDR